MSMERSEGFFARLGSLIGGLFRRWVREREHESPEVVYEQAIAERVSQYRELKSAVAGILYLRAKLESEISDRRADIAASPVESCLMSFGFPATVADHC